jgi:hypothetical protein
MSTPVIRRRKKAIEVDTIQWLGNNEAEVQEFTGGASKFYALDDEDRENSDDPEATATVYDRLHSTWVLVYTGQHIVRGVKGEFYPIAEDVLAETYEDLPAASALAAVRAAALADLARNEVPATPRWRLIITDSESPTGLAPVCTREDGNALHMIDDYPGGPQRDEDGVYDCCPWPQIETYSTVWAAYLVELLNADGGASPGATRGEVLAEADLLPKADVVTWLFKKAREGFPGADVLASKVARGAVRPDNLRMLPADFFEPGHTYVSGTWKFRCETVSASPGTGERRALGWKFAPVYEVHRWHAAALDPDDWEQGWTDVTEGGES